MNQHSPPSSDAADRRSLSNYRQADYSRGTNSSKRSDERSTRTQKSGRRKPPTEPKQQASPRSYRIEDEWDPIENVDEDEIDGQFTPSESSQLDETTSLWGENDDEPSASDHRTRINPKAAWRATLSELALQLQTPNFDTWIRDARLIAYEDGEFVIGLPNAYARDWVENRLRNQVKRTLRSIVGREVDVTFRVASVPLNENGDLDDMPLYATTAEDTSQDHLESHTVDNKIASLLDFVTLDTKQSVSRSAKQDRKKPYYSSQLNAHFTFKSFVVGNHNRLAHAAAEAVANQPGRSFNPLFIYSGVGLGKTHLLHAIGNLAQANGFHTLYCSSEQFTNELISAIRSQGTEEFRNKYRQVDILLIDDIQFIGGKESTQEEFFHTFNHLQASGSQVVLSSDRPPKALATLEERLRSRFEGGLQTDISQPDFETRVAILQSKASRMGTAIPQDVLMLVAERVDSNIRELEGALNQLSMQAQLSGSMLTHSWALSILDNLAPSRTPCSPPMLIQIVADHHGLNVDDLKGRRRTGEIAGARQIAMFLLRTENDLSLPAIGTLLGGRDHTTVRYGVAKIQDALGCDELLKQTIAELRQKVYTPYIG